MTVLYKDSRKQESCKRTGFNLSETTCQKRSIQLSPTFEKPLLSFYVLEGSQDYTRVSI